ncbi:MAG: hypothetical protein BAJALOKI1v1_1770007 [Promethearchaeota archaeon]|nr:MAG: hypothetical protein BAJALOKI1v1_1770007 [Candidatus Lokiarchaeota archaeon]
MYSKKIITLVFLFYILLFLEDLRCFEEIRTPIWGDRMSKPIRTFIAHYKNTFKEVAFFRTEDSEGGAKVFRDMADMCEKTPKVILKITKKDIKNGNYFSKVNTFIEKLS